MQTEQIQTARKRWEQGRKSDVRKLRKLLATEPEDAVEDLKETGHGCRWLIERWERLGRLLETDGSWSDRDCTEAIQLQGLLPATATRRFSDDASLTKRMNTCSSPRRRSRTSTPRSAFDARLVLLIPRQTAEEKEAEKKVGGRDAAACLVWLKAKVAEKLAPLRAIEAEQRTLYDDPDREEAELKALMLRGSSGDGLAALRADARAVVRPGGGRAGKARAETDAPMFADPREPDGTVAHDCSDSPAPEVESGSNEVSAWPGLLARAAERLLAPNEAKFGEAQERKSCSRGG